jgi:hypothetical protein
MENLIIHKTHKTPKIEFLTNGKFSISGRGMATDPKLFYKPVLEWVDNYLKNPSTLTEISIIMEYTQSGDVKIISEILRKFRPLADTDHKISINWYYENGDADQKELGDSIAKSVKLPFNLIELD